MREALLAKLCVGVRILPGPYEWDAAHKKHTALCKPVIAAINGLCLGGGFEIMPSADIRIAADTAEFGLPESGVGVVPAGRTLTSLIRQIPTHGR